MPSLETSRWALSKPAAILEAVSTLIVCVTESVSRSSSAMSKPPFMSMSTNSVPPSALSSSPADSQPSGRGKMFSAREKSMLSPSQGMRYTPQPPPGNSSPESGSPFSSLTSGTKYRYPSEPSTLSERTFMPFM